MLVIGNHVSPYARKVFIVLALKGIEFEVDPIVPFFGNDEFSRLSPLRRIPVLVDGDQVVNDSTVICEYLEERFPDPALLPRSPADRAKARWIEEYCDSRLGEALIWKLFFQRVIGPGVWRQATDEAVVADAMENDIPAIMEWLEEIAPGKGFLFGECVSIADIAPACFFRNAALAGWEPDPARWPNAAGWISRVQSLPEFAATIAPEQALLNNPPQLHRAKIAEAGVRISERSFADMRPRKGIMHLPGLE